jgi:hypothetical protein
MKFDDIAQYVLDQGYKEYPSSHGIARDSGARSFEKRLPKGTPCKCNDDKVSWHITVWPEIRIDQNRNSVPSVEVEIFGEQQGGTWFKLKAYSIDIDNLSVSLDRAEQNVLAAWQGVWRAGFGYGEKKDDK